ncbi:MAG: GDSL-type esterase/lipase family protein [Butyrivibrio sp.]|nr:GDSL-type esterase/lipase family protein [Acetatifactor muris]MCM1559692.1 GDSL-type esterase/lipase family protein [Butyrivibrio sp.]
MKQLKKCYYLILLAAVGIIYLSRVDHWKVYAQAAQQVKEFCLGDAGREYGEERPKDGAGRDGIPAEAGADMDGTLAKAGTDRDGTLTEAGADGNGTSAEAGTDRDGTLTEAGADGNGTSAEAGADRSGALTEAGADRGEMSAEAGADRSGASAGVGADPNGTSADAGQAQAEGDGPKGQPGVQTSGADVYEGPVFTTVEDDYFSDAVFIGDSRTVGMYEYGGLEEISTFYASTGLTVYKIFDAEIVKVPGQKKKITIEEALQENSFAKIYLMIGINEMGIGTVETFTEKYGEVVAHLQELQPDAVIYIQGIIKVTTARSNQGDYINNEGIEARNLELEKLADNRSIFYLDVNPLICDETGGLVDSYTFDGVHLKAKYIQIWKDYLKENAVRTDTLPESITPLQATGY